jgi:hypothetical protein
MSKSLSNTSTSSGKGCCSSKSLFQFEPGQTTILPEERTITNYISSLDTTTLAGTDTGTGAIQVPDTGTGGGGGGGGGGDVTLVSGTGTSLVIDGDGPDLVIRGLLAGTGINIFPGTTSAIINNTGVTSIVNSGAVIGENLLDSASTAQDAIIKKLIGGAGITLTTLGTPGNEEVQIAVGNITSACYGEMIGTSGTINITALPTGWTDAVAGDLQDVNFVDNPVADRLELLRAGEYKINVTISGTVTAIAPVNIVAQVFINGVASPRLLSAVEFDIGTAPQNMAITGLIDVSPNDYFDLRLFRSNAVGGLITFNIDAINYNLAKLTGTQGPTGPPGPSAPGPTGPTGPPGLSGALSSTKYGEMFATSGVITLTGTPTGWINAMAGELNGVTFSDNVVADRLTITESGPYQLCVNVNGTISALFFVNVVAQIYINGVASTKFLTVTEFNPATPSSVQSLSISGIVNTSVGDFFDLRLYYNNIVPAGSVTFTISSINVNLTKVAGAPGPTGPAGPAGSTTFTALTDTPAAYTGNSLELVTINSAESDLIFRPLTVGAGLALTNNDTTLEIVNTLSGTATTLSNAGPGNTLVVDGVGPTLSTKSLTPGTGMGFTVTATDITVNNTSPASSVTLANAGVGSTLVVDGTGPTLSTKSLTPGTGMGFTVTANDITVNNTSPASSVTLANAGVGSTLIVDGAGPTLSTKSLTAGTGMGFTVTANDITVNNTLDQSVINLGINAAENILADDN